MDRISKQTSIIIVLLFSNVFAILASICKIAGIVRLKYECNVILTIF